MTDTTKRKGPAPLTLEEMQVIAAIRSGRCLSTQYVNANVRLEWECAEGHRWFAIPNSVKRGTWCRICGVQKTRRTLDDVQHAARKLGGRCLSTEYVNGMTPLWFECEAGHRWQALPATVLAGHWCGQCRYARRRKTLEQMQDIAASRGGQCLSTEYRHQRVPLRWRCAAGHEWESTAAVVKDHWCPHCQHERSRTGLGRMREIAAERGGQCLSDRYVKAGSFLKWQCAEGHVWEATAAKTQGGQWCPYCSGRRYLLADMQALAHAHGGTCLSEAYVSVRHSLQWQCQRGHTWWATPAVVVRGVWCQSCRLENKFSAGLTRMRELAAQRGGRCLSESYGNTDTPLTWQCDKGHVWEMKPASILRHGRWCPFCSGRRKYTLASMQALAREQSGECLATTFQSVHDRLQWRCAAGHVWSAQAEKVVAGRWCAQCRQERKRGRDMARMQALAAQRGGQCLSESYLGANTPLTWQCGKGHRWEMAPADISRGGRWCPSCSGRRRYTLADMHAIARERGGQCLSDTFRSVHDKLSWECDRGHVWATRPAVIIRGHWCPQCAILNSIRATNNWKRRRYEAQGTLRDVGGASS
ncbi:conserved hypothetical protein [Burkholderia diffusa]|uniref:hypothetical protein n=1 Tax=Burkholderia diffusa TaxID=488732 RepID=UPI001CB4CD05|nr:hypothetical protein [Burkholderia diffusa]CAG9266286.1 conserved hypothetical protein [Burkholderia diffusa]